VNIKIEPVHDVQIKIIKKGDGKDGDGKHSDNGKSTGEVRQGS